MAIIHLLLIQTEILWEEPDKNLQYLLEALEKQRPTPGAIVVLPEMLPTGFTENIGQWAPPPGSPWETALRDAALKYQCSFILGMARQHSDGQIYNESILMGPAEPSLPTYRKIRPFASENKAITPGDAVITWETHGATICPLICYDLRFPELFRQGLRLGAEVFVVIASWPEMRHQHWETLLRARAIENQAYVVGVNRVGSDPNFHFKGGSTVIDPKGEILCQGDDTAQNLAVEINVQQVRDWRAEFPAADDFLRTSS